MNASIDHAKGGFDELIVWESTWWGALYAVECQDYKQSTPSSQACYPSLHRGAHGFVQLALDMETGEEVAIKFIERGRSLDPKHLLRCVSSFPTLSSLQSTGQSIPTPSRWGIISIQIHWQSHAC